jgi:digeranylgeranylglycerophospholipid reductase
MPNTRCECEKDMYDVAVIGAGPGGATCTRYLAKLGFNVVLIDRDKFPRDKPCGGGFSYNIINDFPYLKPRVNDFLKGISKVGVIHSPNQRIVLKGKVDMAVALRIDFDNALLESAIDSGAELKECVRVKSLEFNNDFVSLRTSSTGKIRARIIVGADGVGSMVARQTGLHRRWPSHTITACRVVEIPSNESDVTRIYGEEKEYHFFTNLGGMPGYGWIFPKKETINVGLGIIGSHAKGLTNRFHAFIRLLKKKGLLVDEIDISGARGALVPTGGTIEKTFADRCILVGDSAGMVSPLTGGGIAYAMRAARFGALVISKCLEESRYGKEDLAPYQKMWHADFGKDFGPMLLAQRIFTGSFTDVLFEIGKRDTKIQEMVSTALAESSDEGISAKRLAMRALYVCLRQAFHLGI